MMFSSFGTLFSLSHQLKLAEKHLPMVYLNPIFFVYRFSVPKVIIKVGCMLFPPKRHFCTENSSVYFSQHTSQFHITKIPLITLCCVANVLFVRECCYVCIYYKHPTTKTYNTVFPFA